MRPFWPLSGICGTPPTKVTESDPPKSGIFDERISKAVRHAAHHPEPVNHPVGEPRMSITLYYYTARWDDTRKAHPTIFKLRPGTVDQRDSIEARHRVMKDVLLPLIYRHIGYRLRRMGIQKLFQ